MERVCHTAIFNFRIWEIYSVITLSMSTGLWQYCAIVPLQQNLLHYFYRNVVLHCHCHCDIPLENIRKLPNFCYFQEKQNGKIDQKWVTFNRFLFHLEHSTKPYSHGPKIFPISNKFSGQPTNSFEKGIVLRFCFWFKVNWSINIKELLFSLKSLEYHRFDSLLNMRSKIR